MEGEVSGDLLSASHAIASTLRTKPAGKIHELAADDLATMNDIFITLVSPRSTLEPSAKPREHPLVCGNSATGGPWAAGFDKFSCVMPNLSDNGITYQDDDQQGPWVHPYW